MRPVLINIFGNTENNKPIEWLSNLAVTDIIDKSNEPANRIDWWFNSSNNNALNFNGVSNTSITWAWTTYKININWIKSRSPFSTNSWKIELKVQWLNNYTTINIDNISYSFNKPFAWIL